MFDKVYKSRTATFYTLTKNDSVQVQAHSVTMQNNGNTIVKVNGFMPILPNGFLIIDSFNDVRVYHDEVFTVVFDTTGVSAPRNELKIYGQKITNFPYDNC